MAQLVAQVVGYSLLIHLLSITMLKLELLQVLAVLLKLPTATVTQDLTHLELDHLLQHLPMLDLPLSAQVAAVAVVDQVLEMQQELTFITAAIADQAAHLMVTMAAVMVAVLSKMEILMDQLVVQVFLVMAAVVVAVELSSRDSATAQAAQVQLAQAQSYIFTLDKVE
jgi:cell division protein ZapA (FtsZ GTPase activity inhibitor)